MYLKTEDGKMVVDCYAMVVALPFEYTESSYRSVSYYSMLGSKVKYLGIGMMSFYENEAQLQDPTKVKWHPLGVPMLITSEPSEIDNREISFSPGAQVRKCVVHTYYKGDSFMVSTDAIKITDVMMMVLSRLEQGKLDYLTPDMVSDLINDCQTKNGINLRIPSEEVELFVGERYRDPDNPNQKYRFHKGKIDPHRMISYNTRTEMHKGSTYAALFGEDIQQGMLNAIVRNDSGHADKAGLIEALFRGKDMDKYAQQDFVTRNVPEVEGT